MKHDLRFKPWLADTNPLYDRLREGQTVRIHPATDLFMRGVTSARIAKIGTKFITIEWTPPVRDWKKTGPGMLSKPIPFRVTFEFAKNYFLDQRGELLFPEPPKEKQ